MVKENKILLIFLFLFMGISITFIYSAQKILPSIMDTLYLKQLIWYMIGFLLIFVITRFENKKLFKFYKIYYIIFVLLLFLLLLFGTPINDSKCWFQIPGIGNFQPSEFMKIVLIITLAKEIEHYQKKNHTTKEEFFFLLKILIIVGVPSILTFLEPDTGVVLIYLIITLFMLFIGGIQYRWFFLGFSVIIIGILIILLLYQTNNPLFLKIFGTDFFLRIDRILNWSSKNGYQLYNGMSAIGGAGILGYGLFKTPIYFPEPHTDFIFATIASNIGFLGSFFLILLLLFFDYNLIKIAINTKKNENKYILAGILGMLFYQQIQNIGMTFGLLPITGITLPFISYGGSSLLSYMIMMGIVLNIKKKKNNKLFF